MTGNQAVEMILDPKTLEDTRQHLRTRVYFAFDVMYEEAMDRLPRPNQGVWDALETWKKTGGTVARRWKGGGQLSKD